MMFKSALALLITASAAYAQFALQVVSPSSGEFEQFGKTIGVQIHADVPAGTEGPNVQISICQEVTGLSLCNGTLGRVLSNAPFNAPDDTYNITIPEDQAPGVNRLVVGHITEVGGVPTLTDETSIVLFLGSRI